tara:strand:- start:272 stop:736 length:465 start_codon:yes stop_codon:yes gene_type:complete
MVHGKGNKGNLNLLYNYIKKGYPWPLKSFNNERSYLSIENLNFILNELIINKKIKSGIYNVCDSEFLSTNKIIEIIKNEINGKNLLIPLPKSLIKLVFKIMGLFNFKYDLNMLGKLTKNFKVQNYKILKAIEKPLPLKAEDGIRKTIKYFNKKI